MFGFSRGGATENIRGRARICVRLSLFLFCTRTARRWRWRLESGGALRSTFRRLFLNPRKNFPAGRVFRPARLRRQYVAAASKCVRNPPLFFSPRAPAGGQQADASRPTCRTPEKNIPAWRIFRPSVQSPKFAALLLLFCCTPILFFPGRPTAGGQQANRPRIRRRAGLNRGANRPAFRRLFPNPAKTFGRTRIPPAPASAPVATGADEYSLVFFACFFFGIRCGTGDKKIPHFCYRR